MFKTVILLSLALGGAALGERVRMEPDVDVFSAPSWTRGARVSATDSLKVQFMMQHSDSQRASLEARLMDAATPSSANYGKWLSGEEVTEIVAVAPEAIEQVIEFIMSASVDAPIATSLNRHRDIVSVTLPATAVEALLETELYHFAHTAYSKVDVIRCGAPYSLPADLARVVSMVGELVRLPSFRKITVEDAVETNTTADSAWSACGSRYTSYTNPAVLQERYGFPSLTAAEVASGNSMAVAEFQGQYYDDDDLEAFASACGTSQTTVATTYGGNSPSRCQIGLEPCVESLLDIEYMGAVGANIPLSVYYSGTFSLLDWAETVGDNADAELVHSVSYGNDEVQQTSAAYMYSVNTEFAKLGAKGLTIAFASGDQGVWGRSGVGKSYNPDFPAGSPYVTAVGGTDFLVTGTIGEETTWEDGGGGFSDTFAIPSWQADDVASFFKDSTDLPASTFYNASGRGYPDVAALAGTNNAYFVSFKDGSFGGVGGTSAACPVFSGIVAHLNNVRLAAGGASLGFMNPWIYENAAAFNDVTSGTNSGGLGGGFTAIAGWDAATGHGTPDFAKLSAAL